MGDDKKSPDNKDKPDITVKNQFADLIIVVFILAAFLAVEFVKQLYQIGFWTGAVLWAMQICTLVIFIYKAFIAFGLLVEEVLSIVKRSTTSIYEIIYEFRGWKNGTIRQEGYSISIDDKTMSARTSRDEEFIEAAYSLSKVLSELKSNEQNTSLMDNNHEEYD